MTTGSDTLRPATMKNMGVMTAKATVLRRFLTALVSDVSIKCFDMKSPSTNAGSMAWPAPRPAKYINTSRRRKIYFISGSITLFFSLGLSKT